MVENNFKEHLAMIKVKGKSAARGKRSINRRRERVLAILRWKEMKYGLNNQGMTDLVNLQEKLK